MMADHGMQRGKHVQSDDYHHDTHTLPSRQTDNPGTDRIVATDHQGPFLQGRSSDTTKDRILFTSFYTVDTPYEQEALTLVESLKRFDLTYYIEGLDGRGSWKENVFQKSEYLGRILRSNQGKGFDALVWLDADSILVKEPLLFFRLEDVDFAIRGRGPKRRLGSILRCAASLLTDRSEENLNLLFELLRNSAQYRKPHACVLYLRNNAKALAFMEDWIEEIHGDKAKWKGEQGALRSIFEKNAYYRGRLRMYNLPKTYAEKNYPPKGLVPSADCVIQQNQVKTKYQYHDSIAKAGGSV